MGMLYRRGRIWWIKYYRNGKAFRESSKSERVSDAKRLLRRREGETGNGESWSLKTERVRFEELADDFLNEYRANNRKSIIWAKRRIDQHLMRFFGGFRVAHITTYHVRAYTANDKRKVRATEASTANWQPSSECSTWRLRMTPPKIAHVPHIPMLKENNVRKGFFEHKEYLALRRELPKYLKPVLTFGYFTGAREGEILRLKWPQVDLDARTVYLEPGSTKNDQPRTIPLTGELLETLRNAEGYPR